MFNFRYSARICVDQLKGWPKNPRVYMGLVLGAALTVIPTYNYVLFAARLNEPVNILESFVIMGSLRQHMTFILLGLLLILSDAPFVSQRTTYTIVRTSRKSWLIGSLMYVFVASAIYYLFILFVSILVAGSSGFLANFWSDPMYTLSIQQPNSALTDYGVFFPYPDLVRNLSPIWAFIHTYILSVIYAAILSSIMFSINLYKGKILGNVAALGVHAAGYILISEALFVVPKFSLLANSLLGFHTFAGNNPSPFLLRSSYSLFGGIILGLFLFAIFAMKRFDYRISVGDKE